MTSVLPIGATVDELTAARQAAAATRGEWLQQVREGVLTLGDLITAAAADDRSPLRAIWLQTAIDAELSDGESGRAAAAKRAMTHLMTTLEITEANTPSKVSVGWLLEKRSGQRRLIALAEAVERARSNERRTPWAGFPLAEGTVRP